MVNGTEAKEIALYFMGLKDIPTTKPNVIKNISIAKSILELGYPKDSVLMAIDINVDKMFSLGYIKFVIEEVHKAILAKAKEDEIKNALAKIKTNTIFSESGDNERNSNREKLERRTNISRKRTPSTNDLFKQQ